MLDAHNERKRLKHVLHAAGSVQQEIVIIFQNNSCLVSHVMWVHFVRFFSSCLKLNTVRTLSANEGG